MGTRVKPAITGGSAAERGVRIVAYRGTGDSAASMMAAASRR
jgi:hypothetical protein